MPILSNNECRKTGYGSSRITDNMMCAGYKDGEKDSCQVNDLFNCEFEFRLILNAMMCFVVG